MLSNLVRVFPHSSSPELVSTLYEDINYNKVLGKKTYYGSRGEEVHYIMTVNNISANSVVGAASVWRNDIPVNDGSLEQMAVPYYKIQSSFTTNADDEAKFASYGLNMSLQDFKRAITKQAIAERVAQNVFFGMDSNQKQGLANAASVKTVLPADSTGQSKMSKYVTQDLLEFMLEQIRAVSNLSYNMLKPIVIVAPINAINLLKGKTVPLTEYQLKGAGTVSVAKAVEDIVYDMNGMKLEFVPCSLLQGKGVANKDLMLIVAPGIDTNEETNTAFFNDINKNKVNTLMDIALDLKEYQNPPMYEMNEYIFTHISTPGFAVRKDAVRAIEFEY